MIDSSQINPGQVGITPQRIQKNLEMIASCASIMLRANQEQAMLNQLCQVMVKTGNYQGAWIGVLTGDEQKQARHMWQMRYEAAFPPQQESLLGKTSTEVHPVIKAMQGRQPGTIEGIKNQNGVFFLKNGEMLPDLFSAMVMPLVENGEVLGACCLFASEMQAFGEEEQKQLTAFADDLAYTLAKMHKQQDIGNEIKQLQENLRVQQYEQQTIFDAVPAMIFFKDNVNRVIHVNQAAADFYGLEKKEIEGKLVNEFDPSNADKYYQEDLEIINSGKPKLDIIEQAQQADGSLKWFQTFKIPYYDEYKNGLGIIIFSQEVTALKQTEESLTDALEELQKKNYELDKYFYKVSHDIRAPLCSILGLISLMRLEKDGSANESYVGLIEKSVKKLDSFIQTILNHSRTLNSSTQITAIDFNKIINNGLKEFSYLPQAAKLKVAVKLYSNYKFYNDYDRIAIIFRHLISNAIKYMNVYAQESYLNFNINVSSDKAYIVVEDNGIGIEKQYLSKIFDMFFKATDKSDGAGLGLYIVKQTVDKMGGNISVKSEVGKGTSFRIILANFQS